MRDGNTDGKALYIADSDRNAVVSWGRVYANLIGYCKKKKPYIK